MSDTVSNENRLKAKEMIQKVMKLGADKGWTFCYKTSGENPDTFELPVVSYSKDLVRTEERPIIVEIPPECRHAMRSIT